MRVIRRTDCKRNGAVAHTLLSLFLQCLSLCELRNAMAQSASTQHALARNRRFQINALGEPIISRYLSDSDRSYSCSCEVSREQQADASRDHPRKAKGINEKRVLDSSE